MNRQQRRALTRNPAAKQLAGFRFSVSVDEVEILEEALAWWLHQLSVDLPDEPNEAQVWGLRRGEKLRQAFAAALEDRPWKDLEPEREKPVVHEQV